MSEYLSGLYLARPKIIHSPPIDETVGFVMFFTRKPEHEVKAFSYSSFCEKEIFVNVKNITKIQLNTFFKTITYL